MWNNLSENEDVKTYIAETNNDIIYWDEGIKAFNAFRNNSGKKDRSDHRHHAIDEFITACCSPKIIKVLSTYNAAKEEQHLDYRDKVDRQFDYSKFKESIATILVSHSEKQTLIKKRKNKIKTKEGIKEHITYAPQGKLHEESLYAKRNGATVRRVELFNEKSSDKKTLYEKASDLDYSVKGIVKWHYIDDNQLYQITKSRLEQLEKKAFTKEQMENNPFYRVSPKTPDKLTSKKNNKPLPIIKSVRKRFNTDRTLINLPAKDENGDVIYENRYAENESNFIMVFYKYGNNSLLNIRNVKADDYPSQKKIEEALKLKAFTLSHDKFNAIKIRLNILGEIEAKGEECF